MYRDIPLNENHLADVKAEALIREAVRELFASLDQDGNGRLDRYVHRKL